MWRGQRVYRLRCSGDYGRGPHDQFVPVGLLWALIHEIVTDPMELFENVSGGALHAHRDTLRFFCSTVMPCFAATSAPCSFTKALILDCLTSKHSSVGAGPYAASC
jgi:hypothetical protein